VYFYLEMVVEFSLSFTGKEGGAMFSITQTSSNAIGNKNDNDQLHTVLMPDRRVCSETPAVSHTHATVRLFCACNQWGELH
jgi:hypothetical protein